MFSSSELRLKLEALQDKYADVYIRYKVAEAEIESWKRLVSVLERLVPIPAPVRPSVTTAAPSSEREQGPGSDAPLTHSIAESGEEYEERVNKESALALSLGVAPWSPAFQEAINQMRRDIMQPRVETDEEGNKVTKQYTEAEADDLVREAFRLAQASASIRE